VVRSNSLLPPKTSACCQGLRREPDDLRLKMNRVTAWLVGGALSAGSLLAGDLSRYRDFRFGTDLADVAKQARIDTAVAKVVQQRLALIQDALTGRAQSVRITSVDPPSARVGEVVSATGEGIGPANVDELYLTNDVEDAKLTMIEQTDKLIKFKVPAGVKPGRWALMIHTKSGSGTKLFEQPVKVTVEIGESNYCSVLTPASAE
jgi:hypothetical protein